MKMTMLAATAILISGMGQMPTTPPMKMGLWESTSTVTMKMPGMDMPAGMPGMGPRTIKVQSCLTPESYAKSLSASQQQRDCKPTNEVWTGKGFSFDISCSNGKSSGHFEMIFDGMEAAHGKMHMDIATGKSTMTMESVVTTHFVSADCGSVTPDKPLMMH